jgi:hypothetical protein
MIFTWAGFIALMILVYAALDVIFGNNSDEEDD